jgi:hypothetical protein
MKREKFKDVELHGRKWRIAKFDALTGSYVAYKLLFQMLPTPIEAQMEGVKLPAGRSTMSKAEFVDLQKDCLAACSELIMVGSQIAPIPVITSVGAWGVEGVEDDLMLAMLLTVHCLVFNVAGFFEEGALKELTESLQGLSLFGASM